jgi:hypothetical protein
MNNPADNDSRGSWGEAQFRAVLTSRRPNGSYLFDCVHLGEKYEAVDYYVILRSLTGNHFFVQVKTTAALAKKGKLKISVGPKSYSRLLLYKVPVYIVGVEESTKRVYIQKLDPKKTKINSISTAHDLSDSAVQDKLYAEVQTYWKSASKFRPKEF